MATRPLSNSGLSRQQIKKLVAQLDRRHLHQRHIEGKTIAYIEGWFAISEANAIFGFDGWDRETRHMERIYEQNRYPETQCAYSARVRIRVKAGSRTIVREGSGFGQAIAPVRADAHERAIKAAETDATKRALATFGNRFGLSLYERDKTVTEVSPTAPNAQSLAAPPLRLYGSIGKLIDDQLSAEAFCSGLRQLIDAARTLPELLALEEANKPLLASLRVTRNDLLSSRGTHFADILERLIATRKRVLQSPGAPSQRSDLPAKEHLSSNPVADRAESASPHPPSLPAKHCPAGMRGLPAAPRPQAASAPPELPQACIPPEPTRQLTAHNPKEPALSPAPATVPLGNEAKGKLVVEQATSLSGPVSPNGQDLLTSQIDKSQLLIGAERRIRSKVHLRYVSSKPCLICGELPSHAHHLTFAQPRGLSIKVSDEFTVPLCPLHHNLLHQSTNERAFWRQHHLDPLAEAEKLWEMSRE